LNAATNVSVKYKMARRGKKVREKGKLKLSSYFKSLDDGADVALVVDYGIRASFPRRLQGFSGKVAGSRGKFKLVEIKDGNKLKTFIVHPVHLKKL
jgi:large subunit ribosomal protein L21e